MSDEQEAAQEVAEPKPQEGLSAEQLMQELEKTRKEAAKYRTKAKSLEDDRAKEAEEAAKKRGEYEQLYAKEKADREALAAKVSAYEAQQEAELAEIVKGLDDDGKEIVEALQPEKRLAMARKLAAKKGGTVGTTATAGARGTGPHGHATELEFAKADPDGYIKWKYGDRPRR